MEALITSTLIRSQRRPVPSIAPARWRRQRYGSSGRGVVVARASGGRDHRWGRQVDENMIMLRLRIRKIKMMEKKKDDEEEEEGSGMMRWEREYYVGEYGKHVCEVLGLLQSYLMSVRPCLPVGIVLLVALSVFISSGFLLFNSINMMNTLSSSLFGLS
ncbi:hypothetical protein K1719_032448 [Acacia pycnantha]|nr:hypothetical protein K1719_032448 [Acacia pycnantha]